MAVNASTSISTSLAGHIVFIGPPNTSPGTDGWHFLGHEASTAELTAEFGKPPRLTLKHPGPFNTQETLPIGEDITHDGKPVTFLSGRSTLVERLRDPASTRVTASPLRIKHTQNLKSTSPDHCATLNAQDSHEFTIVIKPDSPAAITTTDETKWLGQQVNLPQPLEQAQLTALRVTKRHDGVALVFRAPVLEQMWQQAATDMFWLWTSRKPRLTFAERIIDRSAHQGDWGTIERWAISKPDRCIPLAASLLGQHQYPTDTLISHITHTHSPLIAKAVQQIMDDLKKQMKGEK